jgi:hypothetical protein
VTALVRYQTAILFRSHRWIFPLITYAVLLFVGAAGSGQRALADGLAWSAALLVPAVALLTRSMLTAEPAAARACVAAARGPGLAQLATLMTAFGAGAVFGLAGAAYELVTTGHKTALLAPLASGLGQALVCALVGAAVGTLFNRPLIRNPPAALLSTIAAVVIALVWGISPANAALRGNDATFQSAAWPAGMPLMVAFALTVAAWAMSCWLAGRRPD